jgi:hypothetical protein
MPMSIRPYLTPALVLSALMAAYLCAYAWRVQQFRNEDHPVFESHGILVRQTNPGGRVGSLLVLSTQTQRMALSCRNPGVFSYPVCMGDGLASAGREARVLWVHAPGNVLGRQITRPILIQQGGSAVYEQSVDEIKADQAYELTHELIGFLVLFAPFWIASVYYYLSGRKRSD